jgi:hypothetical protein
MKETGGAPAYNLKMYFVKKSIYRLLFNLDLCIFVVMANPGASPEAGGQSVVANYVATLTAELATMARGSGLDTLGYLVEMVRLEAENEARHTQNGGGRS